MIIEILRTTFNRDLNKLFLEIQSYKSEVAIWTSEKQITNSAGNLTLHLIGNLNTYIGKELGNTGYVRDRPLEFTQKNIPKNMLLKMINQTIDVVNSTLEKLDDRVLESEYPLLVFEEKTTTGFLLIHLTTHLTYHLGQINYHRRITDDQVTLH